MERANKKNRIAFWMMASCSCFGSAGCQRGLPSLGAIPIQNPGRVPAPATGSYNVPSSYAPRQTSNTAQDLGASGFLADSKSTSTSASSGDSGWQSVGTGVLKNSTVVPANFSSQEFGSMNSLPTGTKSAGGSAVLRRSDDSNVEELRSAVSAAPDNSASIPWRSPTR